MAPNPKWRLQLEQIQACNCAYGCPCQFNAYPTYGQCEGVNGYRVRNGRYDGTTMDGVRFAAAVWFPKAMHEGNGLGAYAVDPRTTKAQRAALDAILSGTVGGGIFELMPQVIAKWLPMRVAKIEWHYDDYGSRFEVEGLGGGTCSPIRNPVTAKAFESGIVLPGGFEFKKALVTNADEWWYRDGELNLSGKNTGGIVAVSTITEKGCVR